MKTPSVLAAAALLFSATAALAQATPGTSGSATSTMPGTAPNGTTPGATGGQTQSLQETDPGEGLGYSQPTPSLGASPNLESPTYNPNASGGESPASPSVGTPGTAGSSGASGGASSGG
jgi:hypothetical protein